MAKPVALIFGSGPNVGEATVRTFLANGYRVVQTSRSAELKTAVNEDHLVLQCDVSETQSISNTFSAVRARWTSPSVIVYNASGFKPADRDDPFGSLTTEQFVSTINAAIVGVFQAIKEAVAGFETLASSDRKAFFFTGNALNEMKPIPGLTTLGTGKSGASYLIADADASYQQKGYRFYYVDERQLDGSPVFSAIDGQAHANFFYGLVNGTLTSPWWATFVKDKGYVEFPTEGVPPKPPKDKVPGPQAIPDLEQFSLHITQYFKPEDVPKFFDRFKHTFENVAAHPECTFFELYEDPSEPGKIIWVENWNASTKWFEEEFITQDWMKEYFAYTKALAIKPVEAKFLTRKGQPYVLHRPSNTVVASKG